MDHMGSITVVEELREHYAAVVGSEPEYHEMRTRSGESLGVFEWPKGTSRMGVHLYASAGATRHGPGARQHAVELFLGVNTGSEAVKEAFANMTLSVLKSNTVPQHGVFVAGSWKVIKGRKFTGWVLTERPDDLIPELQLTTGRHVVFLDALPVFPEEAQYRHGNRSDELFGIWEETGVESWNLDRGLPAGIERRRILRRPLWFLRNGRP
ncbi:suppressor of fused domain protein [Arthrobacter sp. CC3]|uniref:suppressor of fused domain protein n=1 Tax=Arthrobacter sp. CC3 TaxID=3029185 RepID=UPI00326400C8